MKTLTLFLSALMLWGYSLSAAADPSCEGRFVNPITDVCWRCIFPLSLGSVQVGKGDLPDTSNPGSPLQLCPAPPPIFVRPGLAIGYWEPMAMTDVSRSPGCMVNLGGFSINLGKTGMGTARKDDKQVNGAFYHVHWYKYPLTYWLNIITSAGCLEGGDMDIAYLSEIDPTGGQQPHHHSESGSHPVCQPHRTGVRLTLWPARFICHSIFCSGVPALRVRCTRLAAG
ncbi:conjugal transfer pilus assembly protein TraU [Klebsiella pneumoniae]|uniref:conjugal transfer pilus assembly protein TraU n=1 Tax=Klebsiella pneumoniae TaxID=573 RepID=UPI00396F4CB8